LRTSYQLNLVTNWLPIKLVTGYQLVTNYIGNWLPTSYQLNW